jgi:hypothetical protein
LLALDEPVDRLLPELAGRRVLRRMDGAPDDTVPAVRADTRDLLTCTFGFGMVVEDVPVDHPVAGRPGRGGPAAVDSRAPDPGVPAVHLEIRAAARAALG